MLGRIEESYGFGLSVTDFSTSLRFSQIITMRLIRKTGENQTTYTMKKALGTLD